MRGGEEQGDSSVSLLIDAEVSAVHPSLHRSVNADVSTERKANTFILLWKSCWPPRPSSPPKVTSAGARGVGSLTGDGSCCGSVCAFAFLGS